MHNGWPFTGLEFTVDRAGDGWSYSIFAPELIETADGFATKLDAIRAVLESRAGL